MTELFARDSNKRDYGGDISGVAYILLQGRKRYIKKDPSCKTVILLIATLHRDTIYLTRLWENTELKLD